MPRPRKYETEAERSAAYRARRDETTARVDRAALTELLAAVELAAAAGDVQAQAVRTGTPDALLRNLARWFRERGEELRTG